MKLYGPRPEDCYAKASSRVLVGKPSTLGKQIINDFCECPKPIQCKCCAKIAYGMWVKNLPTYIKAHISDQTFTSQTHGPVFEMADNCWLSHKRETPVVSAIKAENAAALASSTDLENPAVAAMRASGSGRGANRGRGQRGSGRGVRGRGGGRGGRQLGPKHPQALEGSCFIHHQYGPESWSCADKEKCPMRNITAPKPARNNQN